MSRLPIDKMNVDTEKALNYFEKNNLKFYSMKIKDVDKHEEPLLFDGFNEIIPIENSTISIMRFVQDRRDSNDLDCELMKLKQLIEQKDTLFGQIEYLIRNVPVEDVLNYDIKLIIKNILFNTHALTSPVTNNCILMDNNTPLLFLGLVVQILKKYTTAYIISDRMTAVVCYLFSELCQQAGLGSVIVLFCENPSHKKTNGIISICVYKLDCDCGLSYIGQTKRSIGTRVKEHVADIKHRRDNKSAMCEHTSKGTNHYIRFDKPQILAREPKYFPRLMREAIEISKYPNFNREDGWKIPQAWDPIIHQVKSQPKPHTARPKDTYPWKLKHILVQESAYDVFKKALQWKTRDSTSEPSKKKLCSQVFDYKNKTFLLDYVGSECEQKICVEAYRTTKELLSLLSKSDYDYMTLWTSSLSEANEISRHPSASNLVWINDYGTFNGPPASSQVIYGNILVKAHVRGWFRDDRENLYLEKYNNWLQLPFSERFDKIFPILCKHDSNENIKRMKEALKYCKSNHYVTVSKGKVCEYSFRPITYITSFVRKPDNLTWLSEGLLLGAFIDIYTNDVVFDDKVIDEDMRNVISDLGEAGVPIAAIKNCNLSYRMEADEHFVTFTKAIYSNYGSIFAN